MRKLLVTALLLALCAAGPASAATLPYRTAVKRARSAGAAQARRARAVGWEISAGFRFEPHKIVFAWYGQRADGSGCDAQLVVRYASTTSKKVLAYFRNIECS
jgi:hypothetical protein